MICFIFVYIYNFSFRDQLLFRASLCLILLILKLIFWDVNKIWYVLWWSWIFNCLSCPKTKWCFFHTDLSCMIFGLSFVFYLFFIFFILMNKTIVIYIFYSWLINVFELDKELSDLSQRLNLNLLYVSIKIFLG